jgi:6-phospho-3-hexuloisomerase
MITAQPSGKCSKYADFILELPAQTMADDQGKIRSSVLPMGSLYEGTLFILFEVIVLRLIDKLNIDSEFMRFNHTNLDEHV